MSGPTPLPAPQQEAIRQAFGQIAIPQIVFNGYANGHTASEMTAILTFSDRPLASLVMSPVVAKSFALSLLETVKGYEASTGIEIETISVLTERIAEYIAKNAT